MTSRGEGRTECSERWLPVAMLRAIAVALLLRAAPAVARDIMVDDVRLPDDVAVSDAGSPPLPDGFVGAWTGSWGGSLHHVLVVERMTPDGEAHVVYATGREPTLGLAPATLRRTGRILGDVLTLPGHAAATYRLDRDGTLEGLYVHDAVRAHARLRRVSLASLRAGGSPGWDEPTRVVVDGPIEDGSASRLAVFLFRPDGPGPFPLVVVHHGSTGFGTEPSRFAVPWWNFGFADAMRRRGWIVVFPQRRGRGGSSGVYDEGFGVDRDQGYTCDAGPALRGFARALVDAEASTAALRTRPDVAPGPVLLAGESRGGILAIVQAGHRPGAAAGVVNAVGGWLGAGCESAQQVNGLLFRQGAAFPRPTLWLYGEGDAFYPLSHSLANFETFREAGGRGTFVELPVPGEQRGHAALSYRELWREPLSAYLAGIGAAPGEVVGSPLTGR